MYNIYEEISKSLGDTMGMSPNDQIDFLIDKFCPTEEAKLELLSDINATYYEIAAELSDSMENNHK